MNIEELKQVLKTNKSYLTQELERYGYDSSSVKYNKSRCVFCNSDNMSVVQKDGNYIYKCFSCDSGGDIIKLIQEKEGLDFVSAVEKLAVKYNLVQNINKFTYNKLEKCIEYIFENYNQIKDLIADNYSYEGYYVYADETGKDKFLKLKFRNDKGKKKFPQFSLIDYDTYYKAVSPSKVENLQHYIYNYHNVKKAIALDKEIFFVEGEKDANTLISLGYVATTTTETNNFEKEYIKEQLRNAKIRVICDNDSHGDMVLFNLFNSVKDVCKEFKVVSLTGIETIDGGDVTDWLNLGYTKKDFENCTKENKLWNYKESQFWVDYTKKIDRDGSLIIKPKKTLQNFKRVLKREGIKLKINSINRKMEVESSFLVNVSEDISTHIFSIFQKYNLKFSLSEVNKYMYTVANENRYNPFELFLNELPKWDGKNRFDDFCNIFTTSELYNDDLKNLLLKKWLLQFIASTFDNDFKTAGMLVFRGSQGKGKTTVMKHLLPISEVKGQDKWIYMDEQNYKSDAETELLITGYQLVELSEFAKSLRDVDNLKRFLTKTYDAKRLIYQQNTTNFRRYTIFYGTVNNTEFLQDDENRRFWVVDLVDINLKKARDFDFVQLWAEIKYMYFNTYNQYWLDETEMKILDESNAQYRYKDELDTLIERKFDFTNPIRLYLTSAEVVELMHDKNYSSTKITQALAKMKVEQKNKKTKSLPRGRYNLMPLLREWKNAIPHEFVNRIVEGSNNTDIAKEDTAVDESEILKRRLKELEKEILALKNENAKLKNENKKLKEGYDLHEVI